MRLIKTLYVNGEPVKLVNETVRLSLRSPGRAVFQVQSESALTGLVQLDMRYTTQNKAQRFFLGVIRRSQTVDAHQQRLFCRELTCALFAPLPAARRHPTLRDVVQWYTDQTGLVFTVPDRDYADTRVPAFYTLGDGFHGLTSLGAVFSIDRYIWQQQGDGTVYVGSWDDSRWATRPVTLPEAHFDKTTANGSKRGAVKPQLRPGVLLNNEYLVAVELRGHEMETECVTSLEKSF